MVDLHLAPWLEKASARHPHRSDNAVGNRGPRAKADGVHATVTSEEPAARYCASQGCPLYRPTIRVPAAARKLDASCPGHAPARHTWHRRAAAHPHQSGRPSTRGRAGGAHRLARLCRAELLRRPPHLHCHRLRITDPCTAPGKGRTGVGRAQGPISGASGKCYKSEAAWTRTRQGVRYKSGAKESWQPDSGSGGPTLVEHDQQHSVHWHHGLSVMGSVRQTRWQAGCASPCLGPGPRGPAHPLRHLGSPPGAPPSPPPECDGALLLEVLLHASALISAPSQSGRSPLAEAVRLCELRTCRLLVAARADINSHPEGEETLLHAAAEAGELPLVETLLGTAGVRLMEFDKVGRTALHHAHSSDATCPPGGRDTVCFNTARDAPVPLRGPLGDGEPLSLSRLSLSLSLSLSLECIPFSVSIEKQI